MVWIYGGGFFGGAGSEARYGGDSLAAKGAVVVTLNYRLGSLGFFAHPTLSAESEHNGCSATSRPSAATRTTSPYLANPPART
jgi:carboxylesterase type B